MFKIRPHERTVLANRQYWVAFSRIPRIGAVRVGPPGGLLRQHGRSLARRPSDLRTAGLDQATVTSIVEERPKIAPETRSRTSGSSTGVKAYTWRDRRTTLPG